MSTNVEQVDQLANDAEWLEDLRVRGLTVDRMRTIAAEVDATYPDGVLAKDVDGIVCELMARVVFVSNLTDHSGRIIIGQRLGTTFATVREQAIALLTESIKEVITAAHEITNRHGQNDA